MVAVSSIYKNQGAWLFRKEERTKLLFELDGWDKKKKECDTCSIHQIILYVVSWEPERHHHYSKTFRQEPEGCYHHRHCTVIAPFWLSTDMLKSFSFSFVPCGWLMTNLTYKKLKTLKMTWKCLPVYKMYLCSVHTPIPSYISQGNIYRACMASVISFSSMKCDYRQKFICVI